MKPAIILILFICFATNVGAQAPANMFWALNKNQLLLDNIKSTPASMAYSVRKLKRAYTGPAMRVRRGTFLLGLVAGATGDVAFNPLTGIIDANSEVTVTSVTLLLSGVSVGDKISFSAFYSGYSVFVVTWYDQSGNGRHVTQATESQQPRIVNSGVMETSNSIASILFLSSSNTVLKATAAASAVFNSGYIGSASLVSEASSGSTSAFGYASGSNRWQVCLNDVGFIKFDVGNTYSRLTSTSSNVSNEGLLRNYLFVAGGSTSSLQIFVNGTSAGSSSPLLNACSETQFNIGGIPSFLGTFYHNNHQSEVVIFSTALTTTEISIVHINQRLFYKTP